ncbi:glycosyltransferase family 2 protein [Streptomyces sp. NPDC026665]|uniref:glycosyltransferase family 2 protein n=1 Tax=Streptomyces sp. NPDC026665 TaxID=3154798 RepID=UPI0033FD23AC
MAAPRAWWAGRRRNLLLAAVPLTGAAAWAIEHAIATAAAFAGHGNSMAFAWLVSFLLLWWIPLCWLEKPTTANPRQQRHLDALVVTVQVPAYNEDEQALRDCLQSVFDQTRPVDRIRVVDDGSIDKATNTPITYDSTKAWFLEEAGRRGIHATWDRTVNRGKRHAQMHVLADDPGDIFVTLDSDSILDREAVAEGLKPFKDPKVQSVAGCVIVLNSRTNLLTRMLCMLYTPFTRGFRSAQSVMKRVMVNSGTLAFYRADVVRAHAGSYEHERFLGRPMQMNDDSMLTMYAMLAGDTVHQPSSLVFTLVPETWKHYRNQSMRWMRGTFVRTFWWMKYMPLTGAGFWMPIAELLQLLLSVVIPVVLVVDPVQRAHAGTLVWSVVLVALAMNWLIALRFLMVARDDEPLSFHIWLVLLAPLAGLWRMFVLRPMHLYAMVTCWKVSKWGTRDAVEVPAVASVDDAPPALPDDDTLRLPRIPVAKLLDPETETTLTLPIPRPREAWSPLPEGTTR